MERVTLLERYEEFKSLGYDYLLNNDTVVHLLMDMEDLGITGFVETYGTVATFGQSKGVYEDFMHEILAQGLVNIKLVKDHENGAREYYELDSLYTPQRTEE